VTPEELPRNEAASSFTLATTALIAVSDTLPSSATGLNAEMRSAKRSGSVCCAGIAVLAL
jgi:hypothetical protein